MHEVKINIYNSITKQKENFSTIEPNHVKMYVCGPTVYDNLHIGNARPLVVFDTIRRYLEYIGYKVTHIQNYTDVDDKIIARANETGISTTNLTQKFIQEAQIDMQRLNLLPYTFSPKVTDEINIIIDMIDTLIKKGHAYERNGNVYFDSPSFSDYGILKNIDIEELQSRLENEHIKKHPTDFVLWKAKKQDEPFFDSPWGQGRPGWHIECSAMVKKYLGETIDIHGGGMDLLFPHHENEIAQSTCANNAPLAHYFLHNGFINIDNEKMSKSSGNFFTIRDISNQYGYHVLRFFLLSSHYRSTLNYSDEAMSSAEAGLERIKQCLDNLDFWIENSISEDMSEKTCISKEDRFLKLIEAFNSSMQDDFNTAIAISIIFDLVKLANQNMNENVNQNFFKYTKFLLNKFLDILGIKFNHTEKNNEKEKQIEDLIKQRTQAKKEKNFARADMIREQLSAMGITIEDTRAGVRWKYD